jgi:hypothetical protein
MPTASTDSTVPLAHPGWPTITDEILCPLCEYNLRGLAEPRCPECGFKFAWQELFDAQRYQHPYLFEYQRKHNFWSFWKTFFSDCNPDLFWRDLSPAHVVRKRRLLIYWLIANGIFFLPFIMPLIRNGIAVAQNSSNLSKLFTPNPSGSPYPYSFRGTLVTAAQYRQMVIPVLSWDFVRATCGMGLLNRSTDPSVAVVLLWPWLTLLSLLIYQISMRRAKIKSAHVLRCAIYGCDFGLLAVTLFAAASMQVGPNSSTAFIFVMIFPLVATYRLMFAYKLYLRFSHPLLTVAVSQIMVFLVMLNVLLYWTQRW